MAGTKIDGEAHGEFYWELAEREDQGPWFATFVKGIGYKEFDNKSMMDYLSESK